MSGPDPLSPPDEFGQIAEFFRPLTRGDPGAFDLLDDAAVVTARTGTDLVMTQDAIVEGLAREAGIFGLTLLGGDTVSTPGPFMASGTFLGRCPPGGVIRRSGARPGDLLLVTGPIGDGWLGLQAVTGALKDPDGGLARKFRRPEPRLDLRALLRACARAAADVSDGLIADARHLATASGCGVHLALEQSPLSEWGKDWLAGSPDEVGARITLASGGDDYEIVLAAEPAHREVLEAAGCSVVGVFVDGPSEVARLCCSGKEPFRPQ